MAKAKNILFIMYDQLRRDYLSCYGKRIVETPNMDRLAAMGVRFDRAYVQAPVCGASRMSTYTGRYVHAHGAGWNGVPLSVGEMTMGDHLRQAGMECWLVGKTHMVADEAGMARLGIDPASVLGRRLTECGFDVWERDDGVNPEGSGGRYDSDAAEAYNAYLAARGYPGPNPWHDYANSAIDEEGNILSGWFLKNNDRPANIAEQDSETPYTTRRGMECIAARGDAPWCLHLSYIKPHWPYIVPEPYASMYGPEDLPEAVRTEAELAAEHSILRTMMHGRIGATFSREEVRRAVLPAYMGLIKQCDDQLGVLLDWLEETGRLDDTMIVLTADHGDYMGDHWLGEKMFFHDTSVRVPFLVYDPSPEADATRGTVSDALVEQIDLIPTFVEVAGGTPMAHVLEGRSLRPILYGAAADLGRDFVIAEVDFSGSMMAGALKADLRETMGVMIATKRWKMIRFGTADAPILFDLENDPDELTDLGRDPAHAAVIAEMTGKLLQWAMRPAQRVTISQEALIEMRGMGVPLGIAIGVWDEAAVPPEMTVKYRGRKGRPWQEFRHEPGA
ncbi:MAG: sulfatase-like hydrolase/transferase [Rhodobacter sp.]|nr:sulfatase-like hydrolase/transferase [Paracoccaceae bacterium]MCC0075734.1 sulfatase-like hydrolase/transferase [Rhodobacter sp.]